MTEKPLIKDKGSQALKNLGSKAMIGMMIACSTLEWMGIAALFSASLSVLAIAAGCAGAFGLAFLNLLVTGKLNRMLKLLPSFAFALSGYILLIVVTFIVYVINQSEMNIITRGISNTVYQLLPLLLALGFAFMFGENGIYYAFVGVAIAYGLVVLMTIKTFGLGTMIHDWFAMLRGGGDTKAVRALETHTFVGGMGFFIYYFAINLKARKYTWIYLGVVMVIALLAFKRTLILSAFGSVALYLILNKLEKTWSQRVARFVLYTTLAMLLLSCFLYLLMIKSGLFYQLVEESGINTSSRAYIYRKYENYYELSFGYIGKGFGWVERNAKEIVGPNAPEALHNEILQLYIELGGIGSTLFFVYFIVGNTLLLDRRYGFAIGKLYGCMSVYMITYSYIANGVLSWAISTAIWVCIMGATASAVNVDLFNSDTKSVRLQSSPPTGRKADKNPKR